MHFNIKEAEIKTNRDFFEFFKRSFFAQKHKLILECEDIYKNFPEGPLLSIQDCNTKFLKKGSIYFYQESTKLNTNLISNPNITRDHLLLFAKKQCFLKLLIIRVFFGLKNNNLKPLVALFYFDDLLRIYSLPEKNSDIEDIFLGFILKFKQILMENFPELSQDPIFNDFTELLSLRSQDRNYLFMAYVSLFGQYSESNYSTEFINNLSELAKYIYQRFKKINTIMNIFGEQESFVEKFVRDATEELGYVFFSLFDSENQKPFWLRYIYKFLKNESLRSFLKNESFFLTEIILKNKERLLPEKYYVPTKFETIEIILSFGFFLIPYKSKKIRNELKKIKEKDIYNFFEKQKSIKVFAVRAFFDLRAGNLETLINFLNFRLDLALLSKENFKYNDYSSVFDDDFIEFFERKYINNLKPGEFRDFILLLSSNLFNLSIYAFFCSKKPCKIINRKFILHRLCELTIQDCNDIFDEFNKFDIIKQNVAKDKFNGKDFFESIKGFTPKKK